MTDAMFRVLVVEDDADIRRLLRALMEAERYRVVEAESSARALIEVRSHQPDVVILDLGLPDHDGQEVIVQVRQVSSVPIIVLSARTMEAEKVRALDAGADDYVTKPFEVGELLARVRAALRRTVRLDQPGCRVRVGALVLDLASRDVRDDAGRPVHLTPIEHRLLACLARAQGLVVTRDQAIRDVWGPDRLGDTRGLRAYIKLLRQKIELDPGQPRHLLTEPGLGYRLLVDIVADSARAMIRTDPD
jgi:two-component system KDP operon response regulator KdpE